MQASIPLVPTALPLARWGTRAVGAAPALGFKRQLDMLEHVVPDLHLKHIGDIMVSFALLENSLQLLAQSLLGVTQRVGQIVTAEVSFKALRALTTSLYLESNRHDEHADTFRDLIKRAADAEDRRNQIVHSVWAAGDNAASITRIKTTAKEKHGIRFQSEQFTAEKLAEFAAEIKELAHDIQKFWLVILDHGKSSNS